MMLGRIRAIDDADARAAAAIGDQIRLSPSRQPRSAPRVMPPPAGTPQSVGTNGIAYFDELGDTLAVNPPVTGAQRAAIEAAATLGVGAGRHPTADASSSNTAVLSDAVDTGFGAFRGRERRRPAHRSTAGTSTRLGEPDDDTDLQRQAVIAKFFWGPVPAAGSRVPTRNGRERRSAARRNEAVPDPLRTGRRPHRSTRSGRSRLRPRHVPRTERREPLLDQRRHARSRGRGEDGALDIVRCSTSSRPKAGTRTGCRSPGPFNVIMRCYLPRAPIVDGTYSYPPITVDRVAFRGCDAPVFADYSAQTGPAPRRFPAEWRVIIESNVVHWRVLGGADRELLEDYVVAARHGKRWEAAHGFTLTDEIQVTIAAQAALLVLGIGLRGLSRCRPIIVHPTTMQLTGERGGPISGHPDDAPLPVLGVAHYEGPVIIAWDSARAGAAPSRARPQRRVPRVRAQDRHARRPRRRHAAARARRGTDAVDRGVHRGIPRPCGTAPTTGSSTATPRSTRASSSPSSPKRSSTCPARWKPRSRTCTACSATSTARTRPGSHANAPRTGRGGAATSCPVWP